LESEFAEKEAELTKLAEKLATITSAEVTAKEQLEVSR
jgi:hypothetical protein